jgi:hypothetical protein
VVPQEGRLACWGTTIAQGPVQRSLGRVGAAGDGQVGLVGGHGQVRRGVDGRGVRNGLVRIVGEVRPEPVRRAGWVWPGQTRPELSAGMERFVERRGTGWYAPACQRGRVGHGLSDGVEWEGSVRRRARGGAA